MATSNSKIQSDSESRTVQLLPDLPREQSTCKTFRFTASDSEWKHGSKWANGIMPIIAGAIICITKPAIGVLFLFVGIIILVTFCTLQNISCRGTYNISFDEENYMVRLYSGSYLTHSFSYNDFAQLWFETREETYCIFLCLGCWVRAGTGAYCGGVVYAVMKDSKQYRINSSLCYGGGEFAHAKRMVARANRYYKVDRYNIPIPTYKKIVLQEGDTININKESNRISIGSYCYVDCESVYGVVTGYLPNNYYTIVDLFEKRERRAFENSLTLIKDEKVLNEVNKQYKRYVKK